MMRLLYSMAWWLLLPLVLARLWLRGRREPGYRRNIGERLGWYGRSFAGSHAGRLLWVHAVSVGETRAAEPLIDALLAKYRDHAILLTHMTPTGRATGRALFGHHGKRVIQAYLPYDTGFMTRRFLRHFAPRICVLMETEVWPNLVAECGRHEVPVALVNARLSERSLKRALRMGRFMREAAEGVTRVAAQTDADAARLRQFGVEEVLVTGSIKFDVLPPVEAQAAGARLRSQFGQRPVLLCASTREGEELLILDALRLRAGAAAMAGADAGTNAATNVRDDAGANTDADAGAGAKAAATSPAANALAALPDNTLVVIVPRHPQRFDEVAALCSANNFVTARRSLLGQEQLPSEVQILIGDSMGEMFAYLAACDLAFIGGSLLPLGGQNLIEACSLGKPVVIGLHTFNFGSITTDAIAAGAALRVIDAQAMLAEAGRLLRDDTSRQAMGQNGLKFAEQQRGATARTMALLETMLVNQVPARQQ